MLVSRRRTRGVVGGDARLDFKLVAQMGDDPAGHGPSGADHPARRAQRAQLQGEAEPVVGAPPSRDMCCVAPIFEASRARRGNLLLIMRVESRSRRFLGNVLLSKLSQYLLGATPGPLVRIVPHPVV